MRNCQRCAASFNEQRIVTRPGGYPSLIKTSQKYCPNCQHLRQNSSLRMERATLTPSKALKRQRDYWRDAQRRHRAKHSH